MKHKQKSGITSEIVRFRIDDSSSAVGAGLTGVLYNATGLTAKYKKKGDAAWTTITLATMTPGTWVSGGFIESDSGGGGSYELGIPDAALTTGGAIIELFGVTNMPVTSIEYELDAVDYQTVAFGGLLASTFTTMFSGITSLAEWLGLLAGKQTANATALTEVKATGAGSGTYNPATDSNEALRDNQSSGGTTITVLPVLVTVTSTGINSPVLSQHTYEGRTQSLTFQDADGVGIDMSAKLATLVFTISDNSGTVLTTVLAAGMTNTGSLNEMINITVPADFKTKASYRYSLRDSGDNDFVWSANEYPIIFAPKT